MKKLTVAACVGLVGVWAGSAPATSVDKANYDAYLKADDPGSGPYSFNTAGNWEPSAATQLFDSIDAIDLGGDPIDDAAH